MAKCLLCRAWLVLLNRCPCEGMSILFGGDSLTGEPDAGNPPVRFGGRGNRTQSLLPTPIRPRLYFSAAILDSCGHRPPLQPRSWLFVEDAAHVPVGSGAHRFGAVPHLVGD